MQIYNQLINYVIVCCLECFAKSRRFLPRFVFLASHFALHVCHSTNPFQYPNYVVKTRLHPIGTSVVVNIYRRTSQSLTNPIILLLNYQTKISLNPNFKIHSKIHSFSIFPQLFDLKKIEIKIII